LSTQQQIYGKGHSNTPKTFKYVLSSTDYGVLTLRNVPEGWDGAELTFLRDSTYKGVIESFSTNSLKFVKESRDYIQTAYEAKGIDYEITVRIYLLNNSTFQYQLYFTGKIDLSTYKIDAIGVDCEVIPTGFQNTVLNRDSIDVDMISTKFIGGGENSFEAYAGVPDGVTIPQYAATQNASWIVVGEAEGVTDYAHFVPMEATFTEYSDGSAQGQEFDDTTPFFTSDNSRTVSVVGSITCDLIADTSQNLRLVVRLRKNGVIIQTYDDGIVVGDENTFEYTINESVAMVGSDYLSLTAVAEGSDLIVDYIGVSVEISEPLGTTLAEISPPMFYIYEAFSRTIGLCTGHAQGFYSDLLGRTDSAPETYGSDGDLSLMAIASGKWIRKFSQSVNGLNLSLNDLFTTLNAVWNIGLGFETIGGQEKVRVEKEAYWFDITDNPNYPATETEEYKVNQILDVSSVVTSEIITKEVLPDWYANEVTGGYGKFEYENVQGLKEFNVKSSWAIPVKSVKNNLDLSAEYRADTQGINKLREKPFSTDPTEDVSGDNDVFIFDVKRAGSYVFTVKTDEDFDSVSGGVDPDQSYNLNFSPRRNLERHGNRFRAMQIDLGKELQWLKNDKNSALVTQKSGESAKSEKGDIVINNLTKGYWIPEAYSFEAPVDAATIAAIQANPRGVIKVGEDKYGWILEVQTNNETNKGQFKLLRVDLSNVKIV